MNTSRREQQPAAERERDRPGRPGVHAEHDGQQDPRERRRRARRRPAPASRTGSPAMPALGDDPGQHRERRDRQRHPDERRRRRQRDAVLADGRPSSCRAPRRPTPSTSGTSVPGRARSPRPTSPTPDAAQAELVPRAEHVDDQADLAADVEQRRGCRPGTAPSCTPGRSSPSSDGPSSTPAIISPTTGGWPSLHRDHADQPADHQDDRDGEEERRCRYGGAHRFPPAK